ncbi:ribonuclease Z [Aquimarina sp. W85]|uniref:ribonuclease Z n=1 Tax=Aquimarina rhodophyticola TaxID=3342246 RepID=UPI0036707C5D
MIFDTNGTTTIITQEKATIAEFVKGIEEAYETLKNNNLVVNLFSVKEINASDISEFLRISKKHKNAKHSFVIVTDSVSYSEIPEELTLVPSLREAHDLIEMEEIEKDLDLQE